LQLSAKLDAVFFDCDGVLADTERDGHRIAFNKGFEENNLRDNNGKLMEWGEEQYGKLCEIGGGKERMMGYWEQVCIHIFAFAFLCVHMFVSKCKTFPHAHEKNHSLTLSLYLRLGGQAATGSSQRSCTFGKQLFSRSSSDQAKSRCGLAS
jgi:beta-phosphoglucomutase-like phosphatase (HAD superfamily)